MWCITSITSEYRERMYRLLNLYGKEYDEQYPVVCMDEKSKQLIEDARGILPLKPGSAAKYDYEYTRNGTRNIFVAVEPKAGKRLTKPTKRRTKKDYAIFLKELIEKYTDAEMIHLVQDNLNTHSEKSLIFAFGEEEAKRIMKRVKFHFTPKHASWLNMAEIEIGVLSRQCLKRRIPFFKILKEEIAAWQKQSNQAKRIINWKFTTKKAQKTFPTLYRTEFKA